MRLTLQPIKRFLTLKNVLIIKLIKMSMVALFLLSAYAAGAKSTIDPHAELVTSTMTTYMEKHHVPGAAVLLYVKGKPYSYYFGYADRDKKIPVTRDTIFELGSISKVMTTLLLAEEMKANKLHLADPVTNYFQALPHYFSNVSLKNLATHTAGLPFNLPKKVKTQNDLSLYFKRARLDADPNRQWQYSNAGIGMLGIALEKLTHKEVNQLFLAEVMMPLGMQPIGVTVPKELKANYAQGYDRDNKPAPRFEWSLFPAAGSIKASAHDMQRFLAAAIGLPGTPQRVQKAMRLAETPYVRLEDKMQGLGWQIYPLTSGTVPKLLSRVHDLDFGPDHVEEMIANPIFNGQALIDKTGTTDGFRAYIAFIPDKKSGVVVLMNKRVSNQVIVEAARKILFKASHVS